MKPTAGVWIALGIIRAASVVALVALSPLFLLDWLTRSGDVSAKRGFR